MKLPWKKLLLLLSGLWLPLAFSDRGDRPVTQVTRQEAATAAVELDVEFPLPPVYFHDALTRVNWSLPSSFRTPFGCRFTSVRLPELIVHATCLVASQLEPCESDQARWTSALAKLAGSGHRQIVCTAFVSWGALPR